MSGAVLSSPGAGVEARRSGPAGGLTDEAVVVSATGVVSLVNYGYTLLLLWILPTREFAEFGSISALLLICGTVAQAALPWVLAQEVLRSGGDRERRRLAISFCLFATALQGAGAGLLTCLIAARYSSGPVLLVAFASVFAIFMAATAAGYFQGLQRFRLIAVLRVAEVVVKLVSGLALVALGAGAGGAVAGFALGAGVVTAAGLVYMVPDIRWTWSALAGRHLWVNTQGLFAIQAGVAVLASMDVVIASLVLGAVPSLATYQAANLIGRVPTFIGAALSLVVFPRLVAEPRRAPTVIRDSLVLYLMLGIPLAVAASSMPDRLVEMVYPARYGDVQAVLVWSATGGLMMGAVNLTTTYFQAAGIFRRTTLILAGGVAVGSVLDVVGLQTHGVVGLALAVTVGGGLVAGVLVRQIHRTWAGGLRRVLPRAVVIAIVCAPLYLLRPYVTAWLGWSILCVLLFCVRGLLTISTVGGSGTRPRVLHLGYEDPRRPGAGGGSVRTHEINRRLASDYDITVVCARYEGARERTEGGVRYVHAGVSVGGDFVQRLAYFASIPLALARHRSDLVVEDFGAPFSSVAVPWMTDRPVIGVVQWLFAKEKSKQYHLPFSWVERVGVSSHHRMIAVSDDLGATLTRRNPRAMVTVIANGLDDGAFQRYEVPRADIVYLGRLEKAQKGLDLLLEAYARIADQIDQDLVLGGDGPDREQLESLADSLGIGARVHFAGRIRAERRFEWLAGADLLAMPSRYETFGMVAAESLAVGTPVVSFSIPCLRALVDETVGSSAPAFDVGSFAESLRRLASDEALRRRLGACGPPRIQGLHWDALAARQGDVYRDAIGTSAATPMASRAPAFTG